MAANGALLSDLERSLSYMCSDGFPAVQVQKNLVFFSSSFVFPYPSLPVLEMTICQSSMCMNLATEAQTASGKLSREEEKAHHDGWSGGGAAGLSTTEENPRLGVCIMGWDLEILRQ